MTVRLRPAPSSQALRRRKRGAGSLDSTQIYTHVSIRHLKAVHTATHPGRFARAGQHALEEDLEPIRDDLMARLHLEAEEEG